jgi:hypothetical protein
MATKLSLDTSNQTGKFKQFSSKDVPGTPDSPVERLPYEWYKKYLKVFQ